MRALDERTINRLPPVERRVGWMQGREGFSRLLRGRVRQNGPSASRNKLSGLAGGLVEVRKHDGAWWTPQSRGYRESTRYTAPRPAETPLQQQMTRTPSTSWAKVQGSAAARWGLSGSSAGGFPVVAPRAPSTITPSAVFPCESRLLSLPLDQRRVAAAALNFQ